MTRGILAALALTAVTALPAAGAPRTPIQTASGTIGVRLLDFGSSAGDDPRARIYIVDHAAPGTAVQRRIEVSNTATSTTHVLLYAAAAIIANGSFLGAAGHTANALSTWTAVSPGTSDVPPSGTAVVTVTITVPGDAAPGEQYGAVWAEASSAADAAGVTEVSRVGIRIYLSVGPGGPPAADFTIGSLTAERTSDGRPVVVATAHNTGGRALDMSGTLQLSGGPGGLIAGPFPASLGTTLGIGDTEPVTITLAKQIPDGPWEARITLLSGLIERSAHATIAFPDIGASPPVPTTTAHSDRSGLDLVLAGLLVCAAAIIVMFVRGGHRRRRDRGRRRPGRPRGAAG